MYHLTSYFFPFDKILQKGQLRHELLSSSASQKCSSRKNQERLTYFIQLSKPILPQNQDRYHNQSYFTTIIIRVRTDTLVCTLLYCNVMLLDSFKSAGSGLFSLVSRTFTFYFTSSNIKYFAKSDYYFVHFARLKSS